MNNAANTIATLNSFISRIVALLENELDEVGEQKYSKRIENQKNITEILNKLVNLIVIINKLSKDDDFNNKTLISQDDESIITEFLAKYH